MKNIRLKIVLTNDSTNDLKFTLDQLIINKFNNSEEIGAVRSFSADDDIATIVVNASSHIKADTFIGDLSYLKQYFELEIKKLIDYDVLSAFSDEELKAYNDTFQTDQDDILLLDLMSSKNNNLLDFFNIIFERILSSGDGFLDICDFIEIEANNYDDIISYLDDNPILSTKKIVLPDIFPIKRESLNILKAKFGKYSNIYVKVEGNKDFISISDYEATIISIENICTEIRSFNYSPLEEWIYAFDLVRQEQYVEANNDEKYSSSRDLTSVLLGDKIVCVGFANKYIAILTELGYRILPVTLYSNKLGEPWHRIVVGYLKDDKYGIECVSWIDPTGIPDKNNKDFLNQYRSFGKKKNDFDIIFKNTLNTNEFYEFTSEHDFVERIRKSLSSPFGVVPLYTDTISQINKVSNLIDGVDLLNKLNLMLKINLDVDYICERLQHYQELFNTSIPGEVLLKAVFNVRKNEYYINPEKYDLDLDTFRIMAVNSGWTFPLDGYDRLYAAIFGTPVTSLSANAGGKVEDIMNNNGMNKEMAGVRFAKVLSLIRNKKRAQKENDANSEENK